MDQCLGFAFWLRGPIFPLSTLGVLALSDLVGRHVADLWPLLDVGPAPVDLEPIFRSVLDPGDLALSPVEVGIRKRLDDTDLIMLSPGGPFAPALASEEGWLKGSHGTQTSLKF